MADIHGWGEMDTPEIIGGITPVGKNPAYREFRELFREGDTLRALLGKGMLMTVISGQQMTHCMPISGRIIS